MQENNELSGFINSLLIFNPFYLSCKILHEQLAFNHNCKCASTLVDLAKTDDVNMVITYFITDDIEIPHNYKINYKKINHASSVIDFVVSFFEERNVVKFSDLSEENKILFRLKFC